MLNPEVQRNKSSNKNLKFEIIEKWCDECNAITKFKVQINGNEICMSCHGRKHGLGNPKIHTKTIKSQMKNGTFNMLNPEVHAKATENRIKNYSSGNVKCFKCGKNKPLNAFGICKECNSKIAIENRKNKMCDICNKITPHNGNVCLICHPDSIYRNLPNFIKMNDILYYFDSKIKDYIPWIDYKKQFKTEFNNDFINKVKKDYSNVFMQPTFRNQDSKDWAGAKQAFEQSLVENNVYYFCYIKFYIDLNNNMKPLVVGKSGSLNVNTTGSDVSFSTDINDGPARRFLNEEKLQWDKTKILIIPCKTENEAFDIEKFITLKYCLFES